MLKAALLGRRLAGEAELKGDRSCFSAEARVGWGRRIGFPLIHPIPNLLFLLFLSIHFMVSGGGEAGKSDKHGREVA